MDNYFQFINNFTQAEHYYAACLCYAANNEQRVGILNNLAVLQRNINQLTETQSNYQQALAMYQTLAKSNPEIYLPYVATIMINIHQSGKSPTAPRMSKK